jgi:hypothetical protein
LCCSGLRAAICQPYHAVGDEASCFVADHSCEQVQYADGQLITASA